MSARQPGRSRTRDGPVGGVRLNHRAQTPPSPPPRACAPVADSDVPRGSSKTARQPVRSSARLARAQDSVVRGRVVGTPLQRALPSRGGRLASRPPGTARVNSFPMGAPPMTGELMSPPSPAHHPIKDIPSAGTLADGAGRFVADKTARGAVTVKPAVVAARPRTGVVAPVGIIKNVVAGAAPVASAAASPRAVVVRPPATGAATPAVAMSPSTVAAPPVVAVAAPPIVALPPAVDLPPVAGAAVTGQLALASAVPSAVSAPPAMAAVAPRTATTPSPATCAPAVATAVVRRVAATGGTRTATAVASLTVEAATTVRAAAGTAPGAEAGVAVVGPASMGVVPALQEACADTSAAAVTVPSVPIDAAGSAMSLAVAAPTLSTTAADTRVLPVASRTTDAPVAAGTTTSPPGADVVPAAVAAAVARQPALPVVPSCTTSPGPPAGFAMPYSTAAVLSTATVPAPPTVAVVARETLAVPMVVSPPPSRPTTAPVSSGALPSTSATVHVMPTTAPDEVFCAGAVTGSSTEVRARNVAMPRRSVPAVRPALSHAVPSVIGHTTVRNGVMGQTPASDTLPIAASSMTTSPTSTSAAAGYVTERAAPSPAAVVVRPVPCTVPPPAPVARPPGTEVSSGSLDWLPVPVTGGTLTSVGEDSQTLYGEELEEILPGMDGNGRSVEPEPVEGGDGSPTPPPPGGPTDISTGEDVVDMDVREASESTMPAAVGPVSNPRDGVYTLNESTRSQICTLLRALFVVQKSSDKSIMPFLGIVHYLMGFSALVGVVSLRERSDFFDALLVAFERPLSMKCFMEEAFQCGPQGLHVGGRTRPLRHVAGQPAGLQEDVLRARINQDNIKAQWISRRLSLRQRVNIHPGTRSVTGGLSQADRETIVNSLAGDGVSSKLRERGCIVKYAKVGAVDRKPLSLAFQWDASSTWFPDGLEAELVSNLQHVLLKATPVAHKDCDPQKSKVPRPTPRIGVQKRPGTGDLAGDSGRGGKRLNVDNEISSAEVPPKHLLDGCSKCGQEVNTGAAMQPQVLPARLEHWSADVCRSDELPHGGHVLAIALPMDMDAGPDGRQSVKGVLTKTSKTGVSPYTYSLSVSCGERVPDGDAVVRGASFTPTDGRDTGAASMSYDILRSVSAHMSRRQSAAAATPRTTRSEADGEASGSVRLTVRAAARPTSQTHRFDFTSEFELQTKGEPVQRTPGRVIIFWPGMDPLPVGGAFTL